MLESVRSLLRAALRGERAEMGPLERHPARLVRDAVEVPRADDLLASFRRQR